MRLSDCLICDATPIDEVTYAYLLGLYLGDGCLSEHRRDVYRLRVVLDQRYPRIIDECARAMAIVSHGRGVSRQRQRGCVEVGVYWKHWLCLFPQHGPGRKHSREIKLSDWQQDIATKHPEQLLKGLIHSDGCRVLNRVNGKIYPRYQFTNHSVDIQQIFARACADYGVSWTQPTWRYLSVARAADVARLDLVIGPKR